MNNTSVSIIGGSDGPTTIFIAGNPVPFIIGTILFVIAVVGVLLFIKKKRS